MENPNGNSVRMQFVGQRSGAVTFNGAAGSGRQYRGGNNAVNRYANVHPDDVAVLEATTLWRKVGAQMIEPAAESISAEIPAPAADAAQVVKPEPPVHVEKLPTFESEGAPFSDASAGAAEDQVVDVKPVQTAEGVVKRKRVQRAPKNTPLKDLPEK